MPDEFSARAELALMHAQRLDREARTCTDPDRLNAIRDEMEIVLRSMEDLRAEQILASMPKPRPKRRWWKPWAGEQSDG